MIASILLVLLGIWSAQGFTFPPKRRRTTILNADPEATRYPSPPAVHKLNKQLNVWATQINRTRNFRKRSNLARKAIEAFGSCETPESITYNTLLKCLAKASPSLIQGAPAALVADRLLQTMKQLYTEQQHENDLWYKNIKESLDSSDGPPLIRVKPSARSYATVMDAYARIGDEASAERVEELYHELQDRVYYDETNPILYNTILSAWAKAGNHARCLKVFEELPVRDTISYNTVLFSLAKAGKADEAERILRSMPSPNIRSYSTVMDAFARSGRPEMAHSLLEEIKGHATLEPSTIAYSTVIHGYSLSKVPDRSERAFALFEEMKDAGIFLNLFTYNNLLNTLAKDTHSPEENMAHLKQIFDEMEFHDSVTFGTVLKALYTLSSEPDFAVKVFEMAIQQGEVSQGVLWQFRQAVPPETYHRIVGDWKVLPPSWSANVNTRKKRIEID